MKSIYKYLLLLLYIIQLVASHGIDHLEEDEDHDHDHEEEEEEEREYGIYVTIIGIVSVLICSLIGTVLPVLLKNKSFFKEDTILFGSVKLFGTGVILGVAFIHMLSPANELLTSKYTYELFNEKYTSFAGAFAIIGILITHFVQVYASHFLEDKHNHDHLHVHSSSECSNKVLKHEKSEIIKLEEGDITNNEDSYSSDETARDSKDSNTNGKQWHEKNNKVSLVPAVDNCAANQHEILHLMERKERQLVCYLLEIGISFHSVLIGIAFGLESHGLVVLMIALMFHQFFEGVSLSSVFIEAHFKHIGSIIFMIILYSCTMPFGGVIGLILRSSLEPTSKIYITLQGIIDSMAAGVLIYDILVNILSRHCTSCTWKNTNLIGKNIQLFSFYIGLFIIALIGVWA
ncbi:Zip-domain-containing protein [Neocallimastix lanati (nom. inval.)]|jgi:zinc transporter 1/2/3|uniref:Zip-domain-containing protein n=1 Tax=Neocallimastix californiae TaxID=1754190 RepID=A0A1Y2D7T8_9FUNG|nr:Zip-domain-containing protein [Neocallimastix sp. JGI-2020a]ORY55186.1 Zip-domain-containing protein [Neocallimastix californiae]|eukprot:ORY55186.1 Zip-domain-containing protein [Neocallimastix californiae]